MIARKTKPDPNPGEDQNQNPISVYAANTAMMTNPSFILKKTEPNIQFPACAFNQSDDGEPKNSEPGLPYFTIEIYLEVIQS